VTQIIEFLHLNREKYKASLLASDFESEETIFANKATQLLLSVASNFLVVLIAPNNSAFAIKLYDLLDDAS